MYKLVLIRHGESTWNLENRFTGWTDVDLTPTGVEQAKQAGRLLKEAGVDFDVAHTSVLKRAIWTLWHCLDQMDRQLVALEQDPSSEPLLRNVFRTIHTIKGGAGVFDDIPRRSRWWASFLFATWTALRMQTRMPADSS